MSDAKTKPLRAWGVTAWGRLMFYTEPTARAARRAAMDNTGYTWEWLRKNAGYRTTRIVISAEAADDR